MIDKCDTLVVSDLGRLLHNAAEAEESAETYNDIISQLVSL